MASRTSLPLRRRRFRADIHERSTLDAAQRRPATHKGAWTIGSRPVCDPPSNRTPQSSQIGQLAVHVPAGFGRTFPGGSPPSAQIAWLRSFAELKTTRPQFVGLDISILLRIKCGDAGGKRAFPRLQARPTLAVWFGEASPLCVCWAFKISPALLMLRLLQEKPVWAALARPGELPQLAGRRFGRRALRQIPGRGRGR